MWEGVDKGLKGGNECLRKHCSEVLTAKGKEVVLRTHSLEFIHLVKYTFFNNNNNIYI